MSAVAASLSPPPEQNSPTFAQYVCTGEDSGEEVKDACFALALKQIGAERRVRNPTLQLCVEALKKGSIDVAAGLAANIVERDPGDVDALALLAEAERRGNRFQRALDLLATCVAHEPDAKLCRFNYASLLLQVGKPEEAFAELQELAKQDPANLLVRHGTANALRMLGKFSEALTWYAELAEDYPQSVTIWTEYAGALRTMGRQDECIDALRRALEILPSCGDAWWQLASMNIFHFSEADVASMQQQINCTNVSGKERSYLHFALGKAFDDRGKFEKAYENYAKANAQRRVGIEYDPEQTSGQVRKFMKFFTVEFFAQRAGAGCGSEKAIFVLGMQRSGSTLVEQILGSHPEIEPAGEISDFPHILAEEMFTEQEPGYPLSLEGIDPAKLRRMGELYLERARTRTPLGRPYFIDKNPFNFWHVGLIHLVLPNAKIIDVRRHPLGCCLANFTMSFREGLPTSYRQSDIGRFYVDYVKLMAHYDRVLPGKVHRVIYEELVEDLEGAVRRMLAYLDLPFDNQCMNFFENQRPLESYSNQQVRTPIFRTGLDHWRNYERWLGPLKSALGPVLACYPRVPDFDSEPESLA